MRRDTVATPTSEHQTFDRGFVVAAILIGLVYVVIIAVLNRFVGASTAGVAGVALTALSTAIFKQFESLRFKMVDRPNIVVISQPRYYDVITAIMTLYGLQTTLGVILLPIAIIAMHKMDTRFDTSNMTSVLSDPRMIWAYVAANCVAFSCGGFLLGKAVPRLTIATVAICAFLTMLTFKIIIVIPMVSAQGWSFSNLKSTAQALFNQPAWVYSVWLLYVAIAALAVFIARRKPAQRPSISNVSGGLG